jgi:lysyl-tRNA synthetase class 1
MRWREEQVDFEPGGRDHASENGSYTVSSEISRKIFGYEPPMFLKYEWIGVKGFKGSMGSSLGNAVTLTQLLKVYDKHLIKWFYAKYKSTAPFDFSLDQDVLRYYGEFDRFVKAYFAEKPIGETARDNIRLTAVKPEYMNAPAFNYLTTFMPMVNYNDEMLEQLLAKEGIDVESKNYKDRKQRAMFWLENYAGDIALKINEEFNENYYNNEMTDEDKQNLVKVVEIVNKDWDSATELQNALYKVPITGSEEPKEMKTKQKAFFKHLYNLTLSESKGPKLGILLLAIDTKTLNKLFKA